MVNKHCTVNCYRFDIVKSIWGQKRFEKATEWFNWNCLLAFVYLEHKFCITIGVISDLAIVIWRIWINLRAHWKGALIFPRLKSFIHPAARAAEWSFAWGRKWPDRSTELQRFVKYFDQVISCNYAYKIRLKPQSFQSERHLLQSSKLLTLFVWRILSSSAFCTD